MLISMNRMRAVAPNTRIQTMPVKFSSILKPAAPLFSGWNWTPYTLLRKTADANGQMYPVVVSVYSGVVSA